MARKRSSLFSQDEEEEKADVKEKEEDEEDKSPVEKPIGVDNHHSSFDPEDEDDSENTIPSPNIADFIIKPVVNKPGSKRRAPTPGNKSTERKKKMEELRAAYEEAAPTIVLGLPCQQAATPTPTPKPKPKESASKPRVRSEVIVNRQRLELDKGKETIDGKSKKLLKKMLETYIKRTDLVQKQTSLLLEQLKSEKI